MSGSKWMITANNKNIISLTLIPLLLFTLDAWSANVTVVTNKKTVLKGETIVLMFSQKNKAGWPSKEADAICRVKTSVAAKKISQVCEGVPPGTYAITVYHDVNSNGQLDHGTFGPSEPYGFSNGARGLFGPAKFNDCSIVVRDEDISISVTLK